MFIYFISFVLSMKSIKIMKLEIFIEKLEDNIKEI